MVKTQRQNGKPSKTKKENGSGAIMKHRNSVTYRWDLECSLDKPVHDNAVRRWLELNIHTTHFSLEEHDCSKNKEVVLTEYCDIKQLKKLYIMLKGIFDEENYI